MARKYPSKTTLLFTAVCGSFRKRNSPRPRLTSETSKLLLAKLSHGGLNSREISRYTINEKRNEGFLGIIREKQGIDQRNQQQQGRQEDPDLGDQQLSGHGSLCQDRVGP